MKRSEMIQNIASELIHPNTKFMSYDKALELAEIVLKRIEEDGMLPPSCVKLKSGLTVSSVDVKNKVINYTQDQVLTTVNEWEEE